MTSDWKLVTKEYKNSLKKTISAHTRTLKKSCFHANLFD